MLFFLTHSDTINSTMKGTKGGLQDNHNCKHGKINTINTYILANRMKQDTKQQHKSPTKHDEPQFPGIVVSANIWIIFCTNFTGLLISLFDVVNVHYILFKSQ